MKEWKQTAILLLHNEPLEMTVEEKQAELEKYRILLLAILDYHLEHSIGSMVFDQWDPAAEYYLQQKQQTEKDFHERRLDRLQQLLGRLLEPLCNRGDLHYTSYLKEKTGYDIDVNQELLNYTSVGDALKVIIHEVVLLPKSIVVQVNREELTEKEMIGLNQYLSNQPTEFNFPDCIRKLMVQTNGTAEKAITEVCIGLKGGFGCMYAVTGENLPVKAYWKDRRTVVIETKKEYTALIRHTQVSSFQDIVKIEYIES